eukprot:scaffold64289_cov19-Prasinocladus_malaysianus.AAC.1
MTIVPVLTTAFVMMRRQKSVVTAAVNGCQAYIPCGCCFLPRRHSGHLYVLRVRRAAIDRCMFLLQRRAAAAEAAVSASKEAAGKAVVAASELRTKLDAEWKKAATLQVIQQPFIMLSVFT